MVDNQPNHVGMTASDALETSCRRSTREKRSSTHYSRKEYILLTDMGEPEGYDKVMLDTHRDRWVEAMEDEMKSLHENDTYELVELPKGKKALTNKWIFILKQDQHTFAPRYKVRLVVKGFGQTKGIDFEEIFSPAVKMSSIRMVLALAASLDLELEQMDVTTDFLHGYLEEEIYMEQPEVFVVNGKENHICKLRKSLYGLKQAPRQWYLSLNLSLKIRDTRKLLQIIVFSFRSSLMMILLSYYFMWMIC